MVYLFLGTDSFSKDAQIKKIKLENLPRNLEDFNFDTLYAKELELKALQEKLLSLPVKSPKRIIVIKDAQELKQEAKDFLLKIAKTPPKHVILILDISKSDRRDDFLKGILKFAKAFRFKEELQLDAFALSRQINLKKPDYALKVLNQLFKNGERPERILGALRYSWERDTFSLQETKRRLKLLLNCDINIKTGKIKPEFALEKLVLDLCGAGKPFG